MCLEESCRSRRIALLALLVLLEKLTPLVAGSRAPAALLASRRAHDCYYWHRSDGDVLVHFWGVAITFQSAGGTKLPIEDFRTPVAIGGKAENICSFPGLVVLTLIGHSRILEGRPFENDLNQSSEKAMWYVRPRA